MKFKVIFIIFNIVVIVSFLFISFLSPLLMMGPEGFLYVLRNNYWIGIVFLAFLVAFNVFFFKNWRFYSYLDNEDWGALTHFLEDSIYRKNSRRKGFYKTLLNAYIVTSNLTGIIKLEKYCGEKNKKLIERFAGQFSIPYLLGGKPEVAETFFSELLARSMIKDREWIRWNLAFTRLQLSKTDQAKQELLSLLAERHTFVLTLLVLYMLDPYAARDAEINEKVSAALADYRKTITRHRWNEIFEKAKKNIEVLILSQIITEAAHWFFEEKE